MLPRYLKIHIRCSSSSSSVLLPKTSFPSRYPSSKRHQADEDIAKRCNFSGLYNWQRENLKGEEFVLHDGPPYANGNPHIGHAINKILKDITTRYNIIQGRKVHYVPGWDCHGLPIELKALTAGDKPRYEPNLKTTGLLSPTKYRDIARRFALLTADDQMSCFKSWGVMADWDLNCYYTLDKNYVKNQLKCFYDMYEKGLMFRDLKPVYWSPSSKTALAEAELEYDPHHKSESIYLEIPLVNVPDVLKHYTKNEKVSCVIWTTTPWSLLGNQAICYSDNLKYSLVKGMKGLSPYFIIATQLIDEFQKTTGQTLEEIYSFDGRILSEALYHHPLKEGQILPFLSGSHVSAEKGTGLVHTAPSHGPEDFLVAIDNAIKVECFVDEEGRFVNFNDNLNGLVALEDGQNKVIDILKNQIVFQQKYVHSYPLDWRTKKPVILRASKQWFINTGALKEKALEALEKVEIFPTSASEKHRQGFVNKLKMRPYWCISRQRLWGTPIPVLYSNEDDKPLINRDLIENICAMFDSDGVNGWWGNNVEEFVPESLLKENNVDASNLTKGKDIMDIWLDSGFSWSAVLDGRKADFYMEGLDQFTGWFQSSLLTSVALTGEAPYKAIFVHGFAVDEEGKKMSKSIGNVIDPMVVIAGGKDLKKNPAYGVDTLRWWTATHGTQNTQIEIGNKIISESANEISRLRLLLKFLLGVLNDIENSDVDNLKLGYLDSYMLHVLHKFENDITNAYKSLQYNNVCKIILHFTSNDISGFYCHITKDRLYCDKKDSIQRRNCQAIIHQILITLCQALGPITPHLVEEVWDHHPLNVTEKRPFFQLLHQKTKPIWDRPFVDDLMDSVFEIKTDLNKKLQGCNSLEYKIKIRALPEFYDRLVTMQGNESSEYGDLCEIFQVSEVKLEEAEIFESEWTLDVSKSEKLLCSRCRRYNSTKQDEYCDRCQNVVEQLISDAALN